VDRIVQSKDISEDIIYERFAEDILKSKSPQEAVAALLR
jgi:hypothetical protein